MDALKIALETIIVGALALPWMLLLVDLFCAEREKLLNQLLERVKDKTLATVAGAVLFALAYLVGASVGRVAADFFNDEDLWITPTEDGIRASVYCMPGDPWLVQNGVKLVGNAVVTEANAVCTKDQVNTVRQMFAVQEATLLLTSKGNTDRVRYLHQQLVVLRGVALDGFFVTVLCLFGLCVNKGPRGRRILLGISLLVLLWAGAAFVGHLHKHMHNLASEPPWMEIILGGIAVAGLFLRGREVPPRPFGCAVMFSAVLSLLAYSGWWYSEILYDRTIVFFFYAQTH